MRGKGEGLTGSRMKKTASSGRPCGRRIGRRHPAAVVGEEGPWRRLGVLRPCVGRRRGARVLGGVPGLVREARGRRWPRQQQAAATVALGCVREKEQRRRWGRGSEREGSRGRGGAEEKARGVVVASGEADEQGGGVASSGACAESLLCLLARGGRRQGGGGGLGRTVLDQHRSWAGSGGLHG